MLSSFQILYKLLILHYIMTKNISKTEARKEIKNFFDNIFNKSAKDVKKIKRLAMKHNIPLREYRKKFCKHCLNPYQTPSIRIKDDVLRIICDTCKNMSRWRIKK